ncbi:hypothetical protein CEXT_779531 [Caerostris extrusa]|uniref:Secreted protein n=1 Tax=Caerostris extrusa TaxID=172846 RepID=A0AAV4XZK4_CAEEX|nr:hypothetical protein CEXT_779531 [Caerostris extrusa]
MFLEIVSAHALFQVLGIVSSMTAVVCVVTVAARKYRQRHYDTRRSPWWPTCRRTSLWRTCTAPHVTRGLLVPLPSNKHPLHHGHKDMNHSVRTATFH